MKPSHCIEIKIKPADIDQMGHVNNVVYLQWIQDVAIAHWTSIARPEYLEKYRWVVLRHEIDYLKPALPGDDITACTWIAELKGVRSIRMVEIKRGKTILAKARTTWVMLDAISGRPSRVNEDMKNEFL